MRKQQLFIYLFIFKFCQVFIAFHDNRSFEILRIRPLNQTPFFVGV